MLSILLHHKMYPWMEFLKTNEVGRGDGEGVISLACFLTSTSVLCVDLNLVVGFCFVWVFLLIFH